MNAKPKPIYAVREEGGDLIPFDKLRECYVEAVENGAEHSRKNWNNHFRVHAIYFADGSQFDMVNGWREHLCNKPTVRVPMGRVVL